MPQSIVIQIPFQLPADSVSKAGLDAYNSEQALALAAVVEELIHQGYRSVTYPYSAELMQRRQVKKVYSEGRWQTEIEGDGFAGVIAAYEALLTQKRYQHQRGVLRFWPIAIPPLNLLEEPLQFSIDDIEELVVDFAAHATDAALLLMRTDNVRFAITCFREDPISKRFEEFAQNIFHQLSKFELLAIQTEELTKCSLEKEFVKNEKVRIRGERQKILKNIFDVIKAFRRDNNLAASSIIQSKQESKPHDRPAQNLDSTRKQLAEVKMAGAVNYYKAFSGDSGIQLVKGGWFAEFLASESLAQKEQAKRAKEEGVVEFEMQTFGVQQPTKIYDEELAVASAAVTAKSAESASPQQPVALTGGEDKQIPTTQQTPVQSADAEQTQSTVATALYMPDHRLGAALVTLPRDMETDDAFSPDTAESKQPLSHRQQLVQLFGLGLFGGNVKQQPDRKVVHMLSLEDLVLTANSSLYDSNISNFVKQTMREALRFSISEKRTRTESEVTAMMQHIRYHFRVNDDGVLLAGMGEYQGRPLCKEIQLDSAQLDVLKRDLKLKVVTIIYVKRLWECLHMVDLNSLSGFLGISSKDLQSLDDERLSALIDRQFAMTEERLMRNNRWHAEYKELRKLFQWFKTSLWVGADSYLLKCADHVLALSGREFVRYNDIMLNNYSAPLTELIQYVVKKVGLDKVKASLNQAFAETGGCPWLLKEFLLPSYSAMKLVAFNERNTIIYYRKEGCAIAHSELTLKDLRRFYAVLQNHSDRQSDKVKKWDVLLDVIGRINYHLRRNHVQDSVDLAESAQAGIRKGAGL